MSHAGTAGARSADWSPMWRRLVFATTILAAMAAAADASADPIELVVHGGTGQIWLHNPNAAPFDFLFYSISSAGSALNGANGVWTSIADTYDATAPMPGQGSVDPNDSWTELSATAHMLAEGAFFGDGGTLAVDQLVSLGLIWSPAAGMGDLAAEVLEASASEPVAMLKVFRSYDSDFDFDFDVDYTDLATWRANFGTGTLPSEGDADLDGDVDGEDFLMWQRDVANILSSGSAAGHGMSVLSAASVPEPAAASLLGVGGGALLLARLAFSRRRGRRTCGRATGSRQ